MRIPKISKTCDPKMRNVGVHPAFFVAAFDQMAYDFRHNGFVRPALFKSGRVFDSYWCCAAVSRDTRWSEFLSGTAGVPPALAFPPTGHQRVRRSAKAGKMPAVPERNTNRRRVAYERTSQVMHFHWTIRRGQKTRVAESLI